MISELQRQAYLRAIGVECYLPRLQLPGAKPSLQCEMPRPAVSDSVISAPQAVGVDSDPAATDKRVAVGSATTAQQLLEGAIPSRKVLRQETEQPARESSVKAPVPHFSLSIARVGSLLLVDEGITADKDPNSYLQLIHNLCFALGVGGEKLVFDVFAWPMAKVRGNHVDQSATAACQALQAFLGKQLEQNQARYLVLMGKTSQHYLLTEDIQSGVMFKHPQLATACITTASILQALDDAVLKAQIWRELMPLINALRSN